MANVMNQPKKEESSADKYREEDLHHGTNGTLTDNLNSGKINHDEQKK